MTVLEQKPDRLHHDVREPHAFTRDLDRLIAAATNGKGGTRQVRDGWENFKTQLLLA